VTGEIWNPGARSDAAYLPPLQSDSTSRYPTYQAYDTRSAP
jgi:hypothetical protein